MGSNLITLYRNELYEKVWTVPMSTLCKAYQLSDNGLRKICKKMSIPCPPAGYWAKIQHGQKVPRQHLPTAGLNTLCEYKLYVQEPKTEVITELSQGEKAPKKQLLDVKIIDNLRDPHYLIKLHKIAQNGTDQESYEKRLWMGIDKKSENRALILLNNIFNALEIRRISVFRKPRNEKGMVDVKHEGCAISLSLMEKQSRQKAANPTDWHKHDLVFNGKLEIQISPYLGSDIKTVFLDTDTKKIEDFIPEIVSNIIWGFPYLKEQKDLAEIRQKQEWELQEKKWQEEKRLKEEQRKYDVLKKLASSYSDYIQIRNLLDYISRQFISQINENEDLKDWLNWAVETNEENNEIKDLGFLKNFEKPKSRWSY
ncbi:MAG: hypothetical protein LWX56_00600 [Ignavibacteria bacterium]|nr:hypothetical protein [Ignavibacteria bacterium]